MLVPTESLRKAMWNDPCVQCYQDAQLPDPLTAHTIKTVFLAGPTSRRRVLASNWRCVAVHLLRQCGYEGIIYVPEMRGLGEVHGDFTEKVYIHYWESTRLAHARRVMFWIPRDRDDQLGLNTNLELGMFLGPPGKPMPYEVWESLYVGWSPEAQRMGLPRHYVAQKGVRHFDRLDTLCDAVAKSL